MILLDANILLYAVDATAPKHPVARSFLEQRLSATESTGFSWMALTAFIRIGTNSRVLLNPLTPEEAAGYVDGWLAQPCAVILEPTQSHWEVFRTLLVSGGVNGPLVMDAHIAALAIEHGATLFSSDGDFARFKELNWTNPLV